jgi:hypothetical protein
MHGCVKVVGLIAPWACADAATKARAEQDRADLASGRVMVLEGELDRTQRQADTEVGCLAQPLNMPTR